MSFIDDQVLLFSTFSEKVQQDIVKQAMKSYQSSDMEYIQRIINTDITRQIMIDLGMAVAIDGMINDYDKIISGISKKILSKVPPGTIEMLKDLDSQFFFNHVRDVGEKLKRVLIHSSMGGVSEAQLRIQLLDATKTLSRAQIGSLTNTALRTMSRATFAAGASQLPEDTRYTYVGAIDSKNRPECAQVLHDPQNVIGYTIEEISALPVGFVEGGGFNCRQSWQLA